jgi:hypothetical protein
LSQHGGDICPTTATSLTHPHPTRVLFHHIKTPEVVRAEDHRADALLFSRRTTDNRVSSRSHIYQLTHSFRPSFRTLLQLIQQSVSLLVVREQMYV